MENQKEKVIYHYTHDPKKYSAKMIDRFLAKGWYRMKQKIFTTTHNQYGNGPENINRVWWLRYNVNEITTHDSHKRLKRKSAGFKITIEKFLDNSQEEHELYDIYRSHIDFDGYESLNEYLYGGEKIDNKYNTYAIRIKDNGKLIAVGLFDKGFYAAASGIHFYDPSYSKYSLGKLLILKTVEFMKENNMQWYYPGYIVVGKPKLDYKLFLGKDKAQYFDYESKLWLPYKDEILIPESYTLDDVDFFGLSVLFSRFGNMTPKDIRELMREIDQISIEEINNSGIETDYSSDLLKNIDDI
jgi:arginyl-tRNA--protein-N-Asp/Glu arginylyltransferase